MTELQINKALALLKCTFLPGSFQKRFAKDMGAMARNNPQAELTEKQAAYLDLLFHQYRRQIPNSHKRWCYCSPLMSDAAAAAVKTIENPLDK
jgi:hypothetical protein